MDDFVDSFVVGQQGPSLHHLSIRRQWIPPDQLQSVPFDRQHKSLMIRMELFENFLTAIDRFIGLSGGEIFHQMMLRHDVKHICRHKVNLPIF